MDKKRETPWLGGEKNYNWKGGRSRHRNGIKVLKPDHPRADNRGYVFEHILIAEKALGKSLPKKAVVHHHTPEQLVVCENNTYHLLLHLRQRALEACGHASWRKCWICQKWDAPENLRIYKGKNPHHKDCFNKRARERFQILNRPLVKAIMEGER